MQAKTNYQKSPKPSSSLEVNIPGSKYTWKDKFIQEMLSEHGIGK